MTRPTLLALCLGTLLGALPAGAQAPALAGLWRMSGENSEGNGPGEQSGGLRRGGPRMRGGPPGSQAGSAQLMSHARPVLQLLIRQDDSTVSISDAAGQMEVFRTDGRKVKEELLDGTDIETSARWKDGRLEVERRYGKAGTAREYYGIDPATHQLVVEVRLSGGSLARNIELRRVYDPAKES
jgi:hypothetical protein